ncbi:MAG: tandem-95 repeat protein, partial [Jannaschia sp.]
YEGGRGADVYFVGANSGNDTIRAIDFGEADELRLTAVSSKDIIAIRDTQDLILRSVDGTTELRIVDQFLGELNPSFGSRTQDTGVTSIVFSDGVMWDRFRISFAVQDPGPDDRTYQGSGTADVLHGGTGNDVLRGDAGGDIYIFRRGDGQDVIEDGNPLTRLPSKAGLDMLRFEGDIGAGDVRLERDGESDDLRIIVLDAEGNETGDTLLIKGQFGGLRLNLGALGQFDPSLEIDYVAPNLIERFIFENGTSITFEDVVKRVLETARTEGDDAIFGTLATETLDGGAGDDVLIGRAGGDTYLYGRDYGRDVVRDGDFSLKLLGAPDDIIEFQDDLRWTDFVYEREGPSDDLTMRVAGTDDAVIFTDFLETQPFLGYINLVERVVFGDGTEWSWLKLLQTFIDVKKTADDDLIYGFDVADVLDGGAGDDRLEGLGGSDRYVYGAGYGDDVIFDAGGGFDQLIMDGYALSDIEVSRTALDLIFTVRSTGQTITLENQYVRAGAQAYAVELFQFADRTVDWTDLNPEDVDLVGTAGNDTITGSNFGEVLDGRGGADLLIGGSGGDTYRWDAGYGEDVIVDRQVAAAWADRRGRNVAERPDEVAFGGGILREELIFSKEGNDLVISITGRPDTLRIRDQFGATTEGVEVFRFFDGTTISIADIEELLAIEGGNRGDNLIEGRPDAPNSLDGRQGDDTLIGGTDADTYAFGVGYDFDEIRDTNGGTAIDRVIFGSAVDPDALILRRDGDDLLIDLGAGADVLRIVGGLAAAQIERFEFASGLVLTTADMRARLLTGTDGNDSIVGFDGAADTLAGGAGIDFLEGGTGNDTYRFGLGDGNDAITDTGGVDRVEFGPLLTRDKVSLQIVGETLVITLTDSGETLAIIGGAGGTAGRVETFVFADGETVTYGQLREELLARNDGLPSADVIRTSDLPADADVAPGEGFDDVRVDHKTGTVRIIISEGDGIDVVDFVDGPGDLVFVDHGSTEVDIRRAAVDSTDLILAFPRTGDQVILPRGELRGTISFSDGVVWTAADLRAKALAAQADDGDDIIFGTSAAETFAGGPGDDEIDGGAGNDTYLFARGDGRDVITDTGGIDDIRITGYAPGDLVISRPVPSREELLLSFGDGSDSILLRGGIDSGNNINTITFSDGTVVTRDQITARVVGRGTPLNDTITGTSASETIEPGQGDDFVTAGGGTDTYVFRRGDGADFIGSGSGFAVLRLPDHDPDDVTVVRLEDQLLIRMSGGDEIFTATNWGSNVSFRLVQSISFRDGTVWSRADIDANLETGGGGQNDVLYAFSGTLDGGPGNDYLDGGSRSNTYVFERGDGRDVIDDLTSSISYSDRIELNGYTSDEARYRLLEGGDLQITFTTSDDEIVIVDALEPNVSLVPFRGGLRFDDVTVFLGEIAQSLMDRAQTDGADSIGGTMAAETLDLGPGDDLVNLGRGADVVTFGAGSGRDEVLGSFYSSQMTVVIRDFDPADLSVRRLAGTEFGLILDFAGSEDVLILHPDYYDEEPGLVSLTFQSDGSVLTAAELLALAPVPEGSGATDGDDLLFGTSAADVLAGGPGNDVITPEGGPGDRIVWALGDGNDTIAHDTYTGADWILDLSDVASTDVTIFGPVPFSRNSQYEPGDLEIRIAGAGGGTIYVQDGTARLTSVLFGGDSVTWTAAQIAAQTQDRPVPAWVPVTRTATDGADTIELTAQSEYVDAFYENGNDTYRIARDSGDDRIAEGYFSGSGNADRVVFTEVASTDIKAMLGPRRIEYQDPEDLLLTWGSDTDSLTIDRFFGFSGDETIEFFEFSDSVTLTYAEMRSLAETPGNGVPLATREVTLTRGADTGLHLLEMSNDFDFETGPAWGHADVTLVDVLASEISFVSAGLDVILRVAARAGDGSDALSVRLVSFTEATFGTITLDGGEVLAQEDILAGLRTPGTPGDDSLVGTPPSDYPSFNQPTFEGGLGDDTIAHGSNGALVIYTRGDGNDLIQAADLNYAYFADSYGPDLILRGIASDAIEILRAGQDLLLRIAESAPGAGDGGLLHFIDGWNDVRNSDAGNFTSLGLSSIYFEDEDLFIPGFDILSSIGSTLPPATDGDDYREVSQAGSAVHEMLGGDDRISSRDTNDAYVYRNGDGHDTYEDVGYNDVTFEGPGGPDFPQLERFGPEGPGVDGGPGSSDASDTLTFPDLTRDQVRFERRGDDLVIRIDADSTAGVVSGSIVLRSAFVVGDLTGYNWLVETITFADGETLQTLDLLHAMVAAQTTDGDDEIRGLSLTGSGPDGDETLRGGLGDDFVDGRDGADTYVYALGDGNDTIALRSATLRLEGITREQLSFDASGYSLRVGIAESAPGAQDAGSVDVIGAMVGLRGGNSSLGQDFKIVLDGDVQLTASEIATLLLAAEATDGPDVLTGSPEADTLIGGRGDDLLMGDSGGDTYVYRSGDGRDFIRDRGYFEQGDVLRFEGIEVGRVSVVRNIASSLDVDLVIAESVPGAGDGGRITLEDAGTTSYYGIEQVLFDDGTVWTREDLARLAQAAVGSTDGPDRIEGTAGGDTLSGGLGEDTLQGAGGDDVYLYTRGDGIDVIRDTSGANVLRITGYAAEDLTFRRPGRDGTDLVIELSVPGDRITVADVLNQFSGAPIAIELVDTGTTYSLAEIRALVFEGLASDGDDLVAGSARGETLTGGGGNDLIDGQGGADTFVYRAGDGDDRFVAQQDDTLRLPDLLASDIGYAARAGVGGNDLVLRLPGERDRVVVAGALGDDGLGQIVFADGEVWSRADMRAAVLRDADTAVSDVIRGFDGQDTLSAPLGDDTLEGGAGNDTYIIRRGDGSDVVSDTGGLDILRLPDFVSSEVAVSALHTGSDSVVLSFASALGQTITLVDVLAGDARGVESIVFSDSVVWDKAKLAELLDNTAPVAQSDGYFTATAEDPLTIGVADLLRNDFDPDGDDLRIIAVSGGDNGFAELDADGNVVFMAAEGFTGPTRITYVLSDGRGGQDIGEVDVRVRPRAEARDDTGFSVVEDGFLTIRAERLLSNDLDGDRMVIGQVRDATGGTVSLASNGEITFTPTANFNGPASFTYVANTPEGGRAEARVSINVTPVNDAPTARTDGGFSTDEDTAFQILPDELLGNDSDIDGDRLTLTAVQGSEGLAVELTADGVIVVTPSPSFFGNTSFTYTLSDGKGGVATGTAMVRVDPVNDAPLPQADFLDTYQGNRIREDNPIVINLADLLANDIELDGDPLTVVSVGNARNGTAELLDNGTILFTPRANFNGEARFDYRVDDGQGGFGIATVRIDYEAVNDNPVAGDDNYRSKPFLNGIEDQPIIIPITALVLNDGDVDGDPLSFRSVSDPENGEVEISADGLSVVFTPDPFFWGEARFYYTIGDTSNAVDGAEVTMFFENVASAPPVANNDRIELFEDTVVTIPIATLLGNDTDIDRDPIEFLSARYPGLFDGVGPINGTLAFDANGDIVFTPNLNADRSSGFFYTITDGVPDEEGVPGTDEGFVDIVIIPVNDEPVAVDDDFGQTGFGLPVVVRIADLLANDTDVDNDPEDLSFAGIDGVTSGVPRLYGDDFIVIDLGAGFTGPIRLDYRLSDGELVDQGSADGIVAPDYDGIQVGGARRDLLIGNDLDETLSGRGGNDDILAGAGADSVLGEDGDDLLDLGVGNDTAFGGTGNDTVLAGAGDDLIDGGDGGDSIDGGTGRDTIVFDGSDVGVRADLQARIGQGGFAQGDVYLGIEDVFGTGWADELGGDQTGNLLRGFAGNDSLAGRDGDDTLEGGLGNDTLEGGAGADLLDGGEGRDRATYFAPLEPGSEGVSVNLALGTASGGDAAGDTLISIEDVTGTQLADTLIGNDQDNALDGARGDDLLEGGAGDDSLSGGRGADTLRGGDGMDIADYLLSAEGVAVDMSGLTAGGGDAEGDVFDSIEIVRGSFHDDTITGDGADNHLRGGRGADVLDGGDGFDVADYTDADEGVEVDLGSGLGLSGEAAGDRLTRIEGVLGSEHADTLRGGAGDDTFDGARGADLLEGGAGSDMYVFGFDSGDDVVGEAGTLADVDRVQLRAPVRPVDVSVVRDGDDMVLELERGDGFLIDTLRVTGHFLGRESGIEEVIFADGTIWDRDQIETLARLGRFNAADDIYLFGIEDEVALISIADLLANDATEGVADLAILSVEGLDGTTATLTGDGFVAFSGQLNQNGDAFFRYTVGDDYGRESTARVEVNLAPVNDAPTAGNDGIFHGREDEILSVSIEALLANDSDIDGDTPLRIVGLDPLYDVDGNALYSGGEYRLTNGKGQIGSTHIEFTPRPDHFGFAGFTYTLADPDGATTTAEVELFFEGVNDAPRSPGDRATIRLDRENILNINTFLANDFDLEDDAFTFEGLHSVTNGTLVFDAVSGEIRFTANQLGEATFRYDLKDARGAESTITVTLTVIPLNDPPVARNDGGFSTLEDEIIVIDPSALLANDSDPNGDTLIVSALERFPENGKVAFDTDGRIVFTPRADFNGDAGFRYEISDGRGGFDTAFVSITIIPRNDAPILFDDVTFGLEDEPIVLVPGEVFGNDIEPDGDVIFYSSVEVVGVARNEWQDRGPVSKILELSPGVLGDDVTITPQWLARGDLPAWLAFDGAVLTGVVPAADIDADATFEIEIVWSDGADRFVQVVTLTAEDAAALESGVTVVADAGVPATATAEAHLITVQPLPAWLTFDPETFRFEGIIPPEIVDAGISQEVTVTFAGTGAEAGQTWTLPVTLDVADAGALAGSGVALDPDVALIAIAGTTVAAGLPGGRPLPEWLTFDAATRQLSMTEVPPASDADVARVQITFTPPAADPGAGRRASGDGATTLEVVIDPATGITPAVQALLAGDPFFAGQGFLSIRADGAQGITAARENRADLPEWMTFDAETLSFGGIPPENVYVGAVAVRLDVEATDTLPSFAILGDVVVDDSYLLQGGGGGFSTALDALNERVTIGRPEDFNGALVLRYFGTDLKGAVSADPAFIVVNVLAQPELPDAGTDSFTMIENRSVTFSLADLLANDVDDDGDPIRVLGISEPDNGSLLVALSRITLEAPVDLMDLAGATFAATLEDGSGLPDWLTLDPATGTLSGEVPMDVAGDLVILLTADDGVETRSATLRPVLDGNAGVILTYTPDAGFVGLDTLTYIVTDDAQGESTGLVRLTVEPENRLPTPQDDRFDAIEETVLRIAIADLLANDTDPDGDALRFVDFGAASVGTILRDGDDLVFTPVQNFSGRVTFAYTVTDDVTGEAGAVVTLDVASTNRAPVAGSDAFDTDEDTPFTVAIADLLANDTDADPEDTITFTGITAPDGARLFTLPDGRIQLVPEDNVNGPLVFTYTISDGRLSDSGTITLNVAAVNDAPIANPDGLFIGTEDVPLVISFADLLANDVDVEGDSFEILEVFDGDNGTVVQDGQSAVFTGRANYFGNAGFSYRVIDDGGAVSRGSVSIRLEPGDDRPIATSDVLEMLEDGTLVIDPADLIANDIDPDGDPIVFVGLSGAVLQGDGTYLFTPAANANGSVVLGYTIDGGDGTLVSGSLRINIAPTPDDPTARDDAFAGVEDQPLRIALADILSNDTDPDGNAPLLTGFTVPDGITAELDGFGFLVVTAEENASGSFDVGYGIDDTTGRTDTATIRVTFAPVNDAPDATAVAFDGTEDTAFVGIIPETAFGDVDGDTLSLTLRGQDGADLPDWLSFDAETRVLSGQPPANLAGSLLLELVVSDGQTETLAPVTVTLAAVNDAPLAVDDTVAGTASLTIELSLADLLANDIDVDGDALSVLSVGSLDGIAARIEGDLLIVDRAANLEGTFDLPVVISDGALTAQSVLRLTLRASDTNTAPVIAEIVTQTATEDTAFSLTLPEGTVSDADADALTLTLSRAGGTAAPAWIAFDAETLTLSGTPPADFAGLIALQLTASDGTEQVTRLFDLHIDPVNDAPVLLAPYSNRVTEEDTPFDIQLARLVADPDGDALTWRLAASDGGALPGWLSFDADTLRLTGTPPTDFAGDVDLRIFATDGAIEISDDFVLAVAGRNDAPVLTLPLDDRTTGDDGTPLTTGTAFELALPEGTFTDADGDTLTLTAGLDDGSPLPSWLLFENGGFRGLAPRDAAGTYALAVTASDGQETVTDVFEITLVARNSAPLVAGESFAISVPNIARLEAANLLANDIDVDGDTLSITAVTSGTGGTATLLDDGAIRYAANFDFEGE